MLFSSSLFTYLLMSACSVNDADVKRGYKLITVTGKIRLVGNEPFTNLVITTDDGVDYLIQGDLESKLRELQYQRVTVKGDILHPEGKFSYRIEVKEYEIIHSEY